MIRCRSSLAVLAAAASVAACVSIPREVEETFEFTGMSILGIYNQGCTVVYGN